MIKVAVSSEGKMIYDHFGHCPTISVFDCDKDRKVILKEVMYTAPEHKPGVLPNYLASLGVDVMISGRMGSGAKSIFKEKAIQVIVGASGNTQEAVVKYLQGKLITVDETCHEHQHNCES